MSPSALHLSFVYNTRSPPRFFWNHIILYTRSSSQIILIFLWSDFVNAHAPHGYSTVDLTSTFYGLILFCLFVYYTHYTNKFTMDIEILMVEYSGSTRITFKLTDAFVTIFTRLIESKTRNTITVGYYVCN